MDSNVNQIACKFVPVSSNCLEVNIYNTILSHHFLLCLHSKTEVFLYRLLLESHLMR